MEQRPLYLAAQFQVAWMAQWMALLLSLAKICPAHAVILTLRQPSAA